MNEIINVDTISEDWLKNYNNHNFCIDVNDNGDIVYSFDNSDALFSIKINENTSKDEFLNNVAEINKEIEELKQIQNDLTISAVEQRNQYINKINDLLQQYELKPIEVKKYNDNDELINKIKKENFWKRGKVNDFLIENPNIGESTIELCATKGDKYHVFEGFSTNFYSKNLDLNKKELLNTDKVFYRPSIQECRDMKNYYLEKEGKLTKKENKDIKNKKDYWIVEFNENHKFVPDYSGQIVTKDLIDTLRQTDIDIKDHNQTLGENEFGEMTDDWIGYFKFYFDHYVDGEVVEHYRIDIGDGKEVNEPEFSYLEEQVALSEKKLLQEKGLKGFGFKKNENKKSYSEMTPNEKYIRKAQVLRYVSHNGMNLKNVDDELKNDKDVVLKAVKQNGLALDYASLELQNNTVLLYFAARDNKNILKDKDQAQRIIINEMIENYSNKDYVLDKVNNYGMLLDFASSDLRDNKEVVLKAVEKVGVALKYASPKLKADKDVAMKVIEQYPLAIKFASSDLRDNKEVVLKAVEKVGVALKYASPKLKADKDVAMKVIEQYPLAIKHVSKEIKNSLKEQIKNKDKKTENLER